MNVLAFPDFFFSNPNSVLNSVVQQKPKRAPNPKEVAVAFAIAVTAKNETPGNWVARNGEESIFKTLQRILPQVS